MYYGYSFYNQYDWGYYFATQSLIWEELLGIDQEVVVSTELFKKGTILDITSYKYAILNTINFYKNQFNGEVYKTILGQGIKINDFQLNYLYNITCNQEGIDVSVMHNTIEINNVTKPGRYTIDVIERPFYTHDYLVYKNDSKQNLLVQGNMTKNMHHIYLDVTGGSLIINKIDEDNNRLSNVEFGIYDSNNNLVYQGITNEEGIISIPNYFFPGLYYIKELTTLTGYEKNNSRIYFEITKDNMEVNMNVTNYKIKGRLIISKKDKDTNLPISNTTYTIYDENHNKIDDLTTNKNGLTEIELLYGKYYYKESKAAEGYNVDDTEYELIIDKSKTYSKILYNNKIKGNLIIIKKDKDTDEVIPNTKFNIYDQDNNLVDEIITNEEGIANINLEYGKYYYQESVANPLYEMNDTIYELSIEENKDYEFIIYNSKIPEELDLLVIENVPNTGINYLSYLIIIAGVLIVKEII
jgi:hypothetical protein